MTMVIHDTRIKLVMAMESRQNFGFSLTHGSSIRKNYVLMLMPYKQKADDLFILMINHLCVLAFHTVDEKIEVYNIQ